jgi:uncharacterized membrane protein
MDTDGQGLVIPKINFSHSVRSKTSSAVAVPDHEGEKIDQTIVIYKSLGDLFNFLEDVDSLFHFLPHVKSVTRSDRRHLRWIVEPKSIGRPLEWTLEILRDKPKKMISWKTVEPSDVASAGSIWLKELGTNRGVALRMILKFDIPNEHIKMQFNKIFGSSPKQIIHEGLKRYKSFLETGEVPTIEGQSHGYNT